MKVDGASFTIAVMTRPEHRRTDRLRLLLVIAAVVLLVAGLLDRYLIV